MIIQDIARTRKSHLIKCIQHALNMNARQQERQILILAPIGVVAFKINAITMHSALKISIKEMHPLNGKELTTFQEDIKYIKYILSD